MQRKDIAWRDQLGYIAEEPALRKKWRFRMLFNIYSWNKRVRISLGYNTMKEQDFENVYPKERFLRQNIRIKKRK